MKRVLLVFILVISAGLAQPRQGIYEGSRVLEVINAYRITRMTEELGLTDEQIAKILPRLRERDSLEIVYRRDQADDYRILESEIRKHTPSDTRIEDVMSRMKDREQVYQEELARMREEIMGVLTVEQQARFIVFEVRFEKELRELINRVRDNQGSGVEENNNQ